MSKSFFTPYFSADEYVVWEGKPQKKAFYLKKIFNASLPVCIVWALFDATFFGEIVKDSGGSDLLFIGSFLLLHMLPVWIYLANIICMFLSYRNTEYLLTNKNLYITGGIFAKEIKNRPVGSLSCMKTRIGWIDKRCGVGSVLFADGLCVYGDEGNKDYRYEFAVKCIPEYTDVIKMVRRQLDEDENSF